MERPFKICLIGCGGIAEQGHGPMLQKYASLRGWVELAACCDLSAERARAFAAAHGFARAYTDMHKMLDETMPDGAVLAVPVELTARLAIEVLARRIPLLLEKPPGISIDEGRAIAEAARQAGVPASVAFNRRTMPLVEALLHELGDGRGQIAGVSVEMCRVRRAEPDFSTTAIHVIDLARYLCGSDYSSAEFVYREHREAAPAADIHMLARTESGAVVSIGVHPMCGVLTERVTVRLHERSYSMELPIFGSADAPGRIVCQADNRITGVIAGDPGIAPAQANGFLGEYTSFFDAVRQGRTPPHDVAGTLQSLELALRMSQRAGRYAK